MDNGYFLIPHATKEKFGVWFVSNSNINLDENKFESRPRKIIVNEDTVVEVDSKSVSENIDPYEEGVDRLVFIKNRSEDSYSNYGDYVYHGFPSHICLQKRRRHIDTGIYERSGV